MPQLQFLQNINYQANNNRGWGQQSLSIFAYHVYDSISLNTMVFGVTGSGNVQCSVTFNIGIYSLTGSTLTLVNSGNTSFAQANWNNLARYIAISTWSSGSQNLLPQPWYIGFLASTIGTAPTVNAIFCENAPLGANAIAGNFLDGVYSVTTNALPGSVNTSEMGINGVTQHPMFIIMSA